MMNLARLFAIPFRYQPWRPEHIRLIASDVFRAPSQPQNEHLLHLRGAIEWLCRAQDVRDEESDSGGVSAGWSFEDGWLPSYPETTGYIIETFLAASKSLQDEDLVSRAARMIDWELSIQHQDGAYPGHFGEQGSQPVIFNTGQIMHGMIAGHHQLGKPECLESAHRAGRWLCRQQDTDGCWRKYEHNNIPHVYNSRATWALLRTGLLTGDKEMIDASKRNLDWALEKQTENGWFANNAFVPDRAPFTHTIAYAIRGFLESGVLLSEDRYLAAAIKAGGAVSELQRHDGWLAGTFDGEWKSSDRYCCLTGLAQMSLNWIRLHQVSGEARLLEHAHRGIEFLKKTQRLNDRNLAVRGGIAGSVPTWGAYSRFEYPNWAAKFFADALMMADSGIAIPPADLT